jgi:hypothetical protein
MRAESHWAPEAVILVVGQRFFRLGFVFQVVGCYFCLALFFPLSLVWAVSGQPLSLFASISPVFVDCYFVSRVSAFFPPTRL